MNKNGIASVAVKGYFLTIPFSMQSDALAREKGYYSTLLDRYNRYVTVSKGLSR